MNDKDGWECGWCGKFFTPLHATRALKHVLKIKKGGIIAIACELIGETEQEEGIQVIKPDGE